MEIVEIYQEIIDKLEQPFALNDLYQVAGQKDIPHPILTVNRFRDVGILILDGEGLFIWNR